MVCCSYNDLNHLILCFRDGQFYFVSFPVMDVVSSLIMMKIISRFDLVQFYLYFLGGGVGGRVGAGWWCNSLSPPKNACTATVVGKKCCSQEKQRLKNSGWKRSASSDQEVATIAQATLKRYSVLFQYIINILQTTSNFLLILNNSFKLFCPLNSCLWKNPQAEELKLNHERWISISTGKLDQGLLWHQEFLSCLKRSLAGCFLLFIISSRMQSGPLTISTEYANFLFCLGSAVPVVKSFNRKRESTIKGTVSELSLVYILWSFAKHSLWNLMLMKKLLLWISMTKP